MSKLRPEEYLLVEFDNFPIMEYGSMVNLSYDGDGDIELLPGVHGKSLLMSRVDLFVLLLILDTVISEKNFLLDFG
jgi:hypothetical protein